MKRDWNHESLAEENYFAKVAENKQIVADAAAYQYIRAGNVYIEPALYDDYGVNYGVRADTFYAALGDKPGKYYKDMKDFDADIADVIDNRIPKVVDDA